MNLSYTISPDRRALTIHADESARAELRELKSELNADGSDRFGADETLFDVFESLIANSELQWVDPVVFMDLTDAPILGIWGSERPGEGQDGNPGSGSILLSTGRDGFTVCDVVERWGYMAHQVRGVLDDLIDTGEAVFTAP